MVSLKQAHDRALSERAQLDALYAHRLWLTNGKGLLVPLGDEKHGALSGNTVETIGAEQFVFTLAGAANFNAMDTPPKKIGIVPYLTPNGSDEWLETPNAAPWNDTAGVSEPSYTWIVWVRVAAGGTRSLWTKTPTFATTGTDWTLYLDGSERPTISVFDDSADAYIGRSDASELSQLWHQLGFTKSTGTTSAAITIYLDGVAVDDTDVESGAYVNQENGTNVVRIGAQSDGGALLQSPITGFVFVPGYVMSANYILRDFHLMRAAMKFKS